MTSLDASIRGLLRVISQIQSGGGSIDFLKSSKPYWHICVEKFHAAYIKAKNPEGFADMFVNFFIKHSEKFTEDVIDEETQDLNDEWLKNKEVLLSDKNKKKRKSGGDDYSFSLKNINCRGEVIYFDETNEKIRNVCIPISEAYLAAVKIYSDGAKKGEYSPLPAQLLVALWTVILNVATNDEDKKSIAENIKSLKDVVDQLTNGDEEDNETGDTLNPLSSILSKFGKKFGLGGENGAMDLSSIEKTVSGMFSGENNIADKAKNIFNKFSEKANIKEGADISTIISSVSEAMKDNELQDEIKGALAEVASKVGFSIPEFNDQEKSKINGSESNEATEQE
jgi:hypothetical protein